MKTNDIKSIRFVVARQRLIVTYENEHKVTFVGKLAHKMLKKLHNENRLSNIKPNN